MSTQKALLVTELGQPVIETTQEPIPQPGPKQVQIQVTVAGVNPHDRKARDTGLFIKDSLPATLANDVAGFVSALGPDTSRFKIGDHIFGHPSMAREQKGLQHYAVLDEDFASIIPESFTADDGVTLPTNIVAPIVAIFDDQKGLGFPAPWTEEAKTFDYANASILIIGGGSNCGRFGVQLAKLAGIGKIVVVGGKEEELKKYGATHVLDRHGSDDVVLKRVRDVVGDDLTHVYDAVNYPEGQHLAVNALSSSKKGKFARLIPIGAPDADKLKPRTAEYELKNTLGISHVKPDLLRPFWLHVAEYLTQGKIFPLAYEVKPFTADAVNEVLDRYRDGKPVVQTHFHTGAGKP